MERTADGYEARITWTTHGVAHVEADGWGGIGFGQGWACARDHLGTIADQIVKVRSERARFHGPGPEGANLASDFGYRVLGVGGRAAELRDAQAPWVRDVVTGYAAGVNAWLAEARADGLLPAWCADAEWIRPIDELDLYAYLGDVALLGSGRNLAGLLGRAEAPGPDGPVPPAPISALSGGDPAASNGWALGRDVTASGHGIVVANPHFPWYGEARFWECHLTIPGTVDVYGVSLLGTPGVQMGFTEGVAWCHTFSNGHRFTMFRLDLEPGAPTRYRFGDEVRDMEPTAHAVEVLDGDEVRTVERTLWRTHHGPMVNLPLLGWGLDLGFCYRDANVDNTAVLEQFLRMDQASDLDELQAAFAETKGMPWVNTLATDRSGRVWYADASATPNISSAAQERYRTRVREDLVAALLLENRVALLDGSDPGDEWVDEPGARSPGLVPHGRLPEVERTDWLANANDSHWLPHPDVRLEGFSPLHGFERTARSLRTRQNLRTIDRLAAGGGVTLDVAVDALLSNESLSAELLLDAVVERCRAAGAVHVDDRRVDLEAAAAVLAAWDGRFDVWSAGGALWRETMAGFPATAWRDAGPLFEEAFDPADPVATPRGLAPAPDDGPDPVVEAVARAAIALDVAGISLDAPLGDHQWAMRGEHRIPVHGGGEGDGVANVLAPLGSLPAATLEPGPPAPAPVVGRHERTGLAAGGYQVTYGTSFVMAVEMTDDGPVGVGILAYGNSGDPRSPHHRDGTEAYADKALRPLRFRREDVDADPAANRRTVTG